MGTFSRLLEPLPGESPGASQQRAIADFPKAVAASALHLASPGGALPAEGEIVLAAVALYSAEDLALLDALDERLRSSEAPHAPSVYVLDTSAITSQEGFQALFPGIGPVYQTPVVGVFRRGALIAKGAGKQGRDLLNPLLGGSSARSHLA